MYVDIKASIPRESVLLNRTPHWKDYLKIKPTSHWITIWAAASVSQWSRCFSLPLTKQRISGKPLIKFSLTPLRVQGVNNKTSISKTLFLASNLVQKNTSFTLPIWSYPWMKTHLCSWILSFDQKWYGITYLAHVVHLYGSIHISFSSFKITIVLFD